MENLIEVPWDALASDTLTALVEEFVTRDGTDYGEQEVGLERKVLQVINGIKRKEYVIVFDAEQESVQIVTRQQWLQFKSSS
ncbi:MAG: YheU family protein [Gammaproteobacteria bacterium]